MRDAGDLAGLFVGQSVDLFDACHLWHPGVHLDFPSVAPLALSFVVVELEHDRSGFLSAGATFPVSADDCVESGYFSVSADA